MPAASVIRHNHMFGKLLILGITSFFFPANVVCAEILTLNYEVTWKFVLVGTIELKLANSPEKNWIALSARARGPFRFFRSYDVNVLSTVYRSGERTYELKGLDRGANEERFIRYRQSQAPIVVRFKEIDTDQPLKTSGVQDGVSVDPFFILREFLRRAVVGEGCDGEYQVYDAKRRYRVSAITESINASIRDEKFPGVVSCRVFLDASSVETAEKKRSSRLSLTGLRSLLNVWPFTGENQVLELGIGTNDQGVPYPLGFTLRTPVGSIVAKLVAENDE